MKYIFPTTFLYNFSYKNKLLTYVSFLVFVILSSSSKSAQLDVTNFFAPGKTFLWSIYLKTITFLYSPVGVIVYSLIMSFVFLWILYFLSGRGKKDNFIKFILPFISLAYLGVLLQFVVLILSSIHIEIMFLGHIKTLYAAIFFSLMLKEQFNIKILKGVATVLISFVLLSIISFTVFPGIGFVLQEL